MKQVAINRKKKAQRKFSSFFSRDAFFDKARKKNENYASTLSIAIDYFTEGIVIV